MPVERGRRAPEFKFDVGEVPRRVDVDPLEWVVPGEEGAQKRGAFFKRTGIDTQVRLQVGEHGVLWIE